MTTSVIELLPTGGTAGWDTICLGYDASPPMVWTGGLGIKITISLGDAAVAGVIDKITIAAKCAANESYGVDQTIWGRMIIGGHEYLTATDIHPGGNAWYNFDVTVNPATSAAWTWPEIDALQAGLEIDITFGGWLKLYQFKVQVTYTPEAYTPPMLVKGSPAIGCGSMIF